MVKKTIKEYKEENKQLSEKIIKKSEMVAHLHNYIRRCGTAYKTYTAETFEELWKNSDDATERMIQKKTFLHKHRYLKILSNGQKITKENFHEANYYHKKYKLVTSSREYLQDLKVEGY